MNEQKALLGLLKAAQTELIKTAAMSGTMPSDNALRKIADLELTIAAVEDALDQR